MNRNRLLLIAGVIATSATAVVLMSIGLSGGALAEPAPILQIRYVTTTGIDTGDCSTQISPCLTLQYAISQAFSGEEIRVAAGIYNGVQNIGGHDQLVNIDKGVILRGGFTTANWTTPDPESNLTILDAELQGRVLYITGAIFPTIEGFVLTGGRTDNNGGAILATNNAAPLIVGNVITGNSSPAGSYGGAMYLVNDATAVISGNRIISNSVQHGGGAIALASDTNIRLHNNYIAGNESSYASAIFSWMGVVTATNNIFDSNQGSSAVEGGGTGCLLVLTNNILTDNTGRGLYARSDCVADLVHNTFVGNTTYAVEGRDGAVITLTNNILAGHSSGSIQASGTAPVITATNNLFWDNGTDPIIGNNAVLADPLFVAPANRDFHLQVGSPAIDQGLDAYIGGDIDGEPRPVGLGPDLGADEAVYCWARINDDPTIYYTVQDAIDASSAGDLVKVAGHCSQVYTRSTHDQVAYVDRSITLQGGYTIDNWTTSNPQANPTILDAARAGRVIYTYNSTPTIQGLILTGGRTDSHGGAVYVSSGSSAIVEGNIITDNNPTASYGGGIYLDDDARAIISGNQIISNSVVNGGAGIGTAAGSRLLLHGNLIADNESSYGGAIFAWASVVTVTNNVFEGNQATSVVDGSGLGCRFVAFNNMVGNNAGRGLYFTSNCVANLIHNTIVSNTSNAIEGGYSAVISATNNIIANHSLGSIHISGPEPVTITAVSNLFWNNGSDPITGTNAVLADPLFVDPANGDFHLQGGSPAINAGANAGILTDYDGDSRTAWEPPDIGADEFTDYNIIFLPLVLRN